MKILQAQEWICDNAEEGKCEMPRRDPIAEILEKGQRLLKYRSRWKQVYPRYAALVVTMNEVIKEDLPKDKEFFRYFPIATIALLEGYYRLVYRDLVNAGKPYTDNAKKNLKDHKLGVDSLLEMQVKRVSIGDVVSHLLPHNSLEDVNANMTALLGVDDAKRDFLKRLYSKKLIRTDHPEIAELGLRTSTYAQIKRMFELRHIFSHELAPKEKPNHDEIFFGCLACIQLTLATEKLLGDLIRK